MEKKIKITENGPYQVNYDIPLTQERIQIDDEKQSLDWEKEKIYGKETEDYFLCRCGHSDTKPYCSGKHEKIGFVGTEVAPHDKDLESTVVYEGPNLNLIDEESLCAMLRFCDYGPQIWSTVMESDEQSKELTIHEAKCCASGRLTVTDKQGNVIESDLPQEISLTEDTARNHRGPLWVKGGIQLEGSDGKQYVRRNQMALCRCGQSRNMPYCDATHLVSPHMEGFDE